MRTTPLQRPVCDRIGGSRPHDALHGAVRRLTDVLRLWRRHRRERRQLLVMATLDDRMLGDIGLSRGDAGHLINKPFWRE